MAALCSRACSPNTVAVEFDAPRILAKRRKYFSDGAERLAYRGALVDPKTAAILEDVVFKESKFEEDHVVVKQEDEEDIEVLPASMQHTHAPFTRGDLRKANAHAPRRRS